MPTKIPQSTTKKIVTFNPVLFQRGVARAQELGVPFQEYVRHLMINDLEDNEVPTVDAQTAERIHQSMEEYRAGKYTEVNPADEEQLNLVAGLSK